jgi:hypothetical protein
LFGNETEDTKVPDAVLAKYNQDEPIIAVGMSEAWKNCLMMRVASSVAQMAKPTNWLSLALAKLYEEGRGAVSGFPWGLSPLRGAMPQWHRTNNSPLCEFEAHLYFWPSERKYLRRTRFGSSSSFGILSSRAESLPTTLEIHSSTKTTK